MLGNRFIFARDRLRGLTHMLIMWGCIIAVRHHLSARLWLDPFPTGCLATSPCTRRSRSASRRSAFRTIRSSAFLLFHGLVWSSFLVIAGVMLAMRRRMRDEGAAAVQRFAEDFMPLILLFAVSLTGLMLTVSYTWMKGYAYTFIAILHAITVIFTLLWLPFGKFFHIFQRPAQLGVGFYKDVARSPGAGALPPLRPRVQLAMHVEDLIEVERQLGFTYEIPGAPDDHYQWICPRCRRASLAMAQGALWQGRRGGMSLPDGRPLPMPVHVNPGLGQGPLGAEDADNFHP